MIALVAGAMFVLLFLLTGSILLPIKTLLMNLLTLSATLGLLVLAFEDGLLGGLFDYRGPEALELISLVFLFSVIFGLATDYAVLVWRASRRSATPARPTRRPSPSGSRAPAA